MGDSPWSNQVQNKVVIVGLGGGLFVYSPTQAKNNLVETAGLTTAGHDQFGNSTLPGDVQYMNQAGTYYALQMTGGAGSVPLVRWAVSSGDQTGTYSTMFVVGLVVSAGQNGIDLGSGAAFGSPPQCWSSPLFARDPVTPANGADAWHGLSLLNGWAQTSSSLSHYQLSNDNRVEFVGALNGGAATGVNIASLPSAYRPATAQQWPIGCTAGVIAGQAPFLNLSTGGTLFVSGITVGTAAQSITLNGRVSLGAPSSP